MDYFLVVVFGLIIGSFLNVLIYRLPHGESIISPPSHCPDCDHQLGFLELIPVISYFILRGRCRFCGSKISVRYPLVEFLTGVIFLINYLLLFNPIIIISGLFLSSLLIALTLIDLDHQILPDKLTLSGLGAGLILSFFRPDFSFLSAFLGLVLAGGLLLIIAIISRGGMGGGDIKMMMMVGTFVGPVLAVIAIFLGAAIGLIVSLPGIITGKLQSKSKLPFGPYLALSSLIIWFWGEQLLQWYLNLFVL